MTPLDTDARVHEIQLARIRGLTGAARLEELARLCKATRELMRAGIRRRHPEYDHDAVELALLRLVLANDTLFRAAKPTAQMLDP